MQTAQCKEQCSKRRGWLFIEIPWIPTCHKVLTAAKTGNNKQRILGPRSREEGFLSFRTQSKSLTKRNSEQRTKLYLERQVAKQPRLDIQILKYPNLELRHLKKITILSYHMINFQFRFLVLEFSLFPHPSPAPSSRVKTVPKPTLSRDFWHHVLVVFESRTYVFHIRFPLNTPHAYEISR